MSKDSAFKGFGLELDPVGKAKLMLEECTPSVEAEAKVIGQLRMMQLDGYRQAGFTRDEAFTLMVDAINNLAMKEV